MHASRLSTFVIDCKTEDIDVAAQFWAQALRRRVKVSEPGDKYRDFECSFSEPLVMLQAVGHESRIHLDIESDDIPAEVSRLEALGAKRIEAIRTWVVMQAPTGQRFCVVRPQRGALELQTAELHPELARLVGHYRGKTKTWLDPKSAPEVSDATLHVAPICGGRWLRIEERGTVAGKPHAGELTLGFHRDAQRFEASWVDSFHTATAIMHSSGLARNDGVIALTGSYVAGAETWGWRTELDARSGFVQRALNISPAGEESIARETIWTR